MKVRSVSYVHEPKAAELWFEAYVDMLKQTLLQQVSNRDRDGHTIETGGDTRANSGVLPQLDEPSGAFGGNAANDGVQDGKSKPLRD